MDIKRINQKQFGLHADNFVTSQIHAKGYSLHRIIELVLPQEDWRVLDIATGGGHTAIALSPQVDWVTAVDITRPMLTAAREFAASKAANNVNFAQADAENLPFPSRSFDLLTCRIAPHHFGDVAKFMREASRVLVSGGKLVVVDNVTSGEPKTSQVANTLDKLRDPSHQWAYSLEDWETFFFSAGLEIAHKETIAKETDFDEWVSRVGVNGNDIARLRSLLVQAPKSAEEWFSPREVGRRLLFNVTEAILVGAKG